MLRHHAHYMVVDYETDAQVNPRNFCTCMAHTIRIMPCSDATLCQTDMAPEEGEGLELGGMSPTGHTSSVHFKLGQIHTYTYLLFTYTHMCDLFGKSLCVN